HRSLLFPPSKKLRAAGPFPYTTLFRSFQLADRVAADRAGEACREDHLLGGVVIFHGRDQGNAVGQLECGLEGFGQALLQIAADRSEEHTSELQSREKLVCRLLLEKKK